MRCNTWLVNDRENREAAGRWLRDARRRAGYDTLGAFARALGLDQSQVSRYELGTSVVPDDRATRIAEVLGRDELEVRQRLGLWVPKKTRRIPDRTDDVLDEIDHIAEDIRSLDSRGRQAVEALVESLKSSAENPAANGETRH